MTKGPQPRPPGPEVSTLPARLRSVYRHHVDYRQASVLSVFVSFLVTFVLLRLLTYGIRYRLLPIRNVVTPGGLHVHHFVWGIFILLAVGLLALGLDQARWHPRLAILFGVGAALVLDEFALWLNLEDVYWGREGRLSVDVAISFAALLGLYLAASRFWRQVVREFHLALRSLIRHRSPKQAH